MGDWQQKLDIVDVNFENLVKSGTPPNVEEQSNDHVDRIAAFRKNLPKKGVTLFSHRSAPNGFKVAVVLCELGIEYQTFNMDLSRHEERSPSYVELNPNARIPSIIDHDNNDFPLWESGAILEYLCKRPQTIAAKPEKAKQLLGGDNLQRQAQVSAWLYFQASGHAPIIGHALQFRSMEAHVHSKGMGVIADRFIAEAKRVAGVLEVALSEQREAYYETDSNPNTLNQPVWLVGNNITLADLAFIPWNQVFINLGVNLEADYPEVYFWTQNIMSRPEVLMALGAKL